MIGLHRGGQPQSTGRVEGSSAKKNDATRPSPDLVATARPAKPRASANRAASIAPDRADVLWAKGVRPSPSLHNCLAPVMELLQGAKDPKLLSNVRARLRHIDTLIHSKNDPAVQKTVTLRADMALKGLVSLLSNTNRVSPDTAKDMLFRTFAKSLDEKQKSALLGKSAQVELRSMPANAIDGDSDSGSQYAEGRELVVDLARHVKIIEPTLFEPTRHSRPMVPPSVRFITQPMADVPLPIILDEAD